MTDDDMAEIQAAMVNGMAAAKELFDSLMADLPEVFTAYGATKREVLNQLGTLVDDAFGECEADPNAYGESGT